MPLVTRITKGQTAASKRPATPSAPHHPRITPISSLPTNSILNRKPACPCGGSCPKCLGTLGVQTKLKIGAPNDKYEQEADRVADRVMRMPEPGIQRQLVEEEEEEEIQTKPLAGQITPQIQMQEILGEEEDEELLQAKTTGGVTQEVTSTIGTGIQSLRGGGQPLSRSVRGFFEPRIGADFSNVQVHTGARAASAARSVNARAFTLGHDVVFGAGEYSPDTSSGRKLLAHELVHVVQQRAINSGVIQRTCYPTDLCDGPIPGNPEEFSDEEARSEQRARDRRTGFTPKRAVSSGHSGRARQLEIFIEALSPGLLLHVAGIFIDQDLSARTGAYTYPCYLFADSALPVGTASPLRGKRRDCVFVPGQLNRQALEYNTTSNPKISGRNRDVWRYQTQQILTHELQHTIFNTALKSRPWPPGVSICRRTRIEFLLGELSAILSEFPVLYREVQAGNVEPRHLKRWYRRNITGPYESIRGILWAMRCKCSCNDIDAYVRDTFRLTTSSWDPVLRNVLETELRNPRWTLGPAGGRRQMDWPRI